MIAKCARLVFTFGTILQYTFSVQQTLSLSWQNNSANRSVHQHHTYFNWQQLLQTFLSNIRNTSALVMPHFKNTFKVLTKTQVLIFYHQQLYPSGVCEKSADCKYVSVRNNTCFTRSIGTIIKYITLWQLRQDDMRVVCLSCYVLLPHFDWGNYVKHVYLTPS